MILELFMGLFYGGALIGFAYIVAQLIILFQETRELQK